MVFRVEGGEVISPDGQMFDNEAIDVATNEARDRALGRYTAPEAHSNHGIRTGTPRRGKHRGDLFVGSVRIR